MFTSWKVCSFMHSIPYCVYHCINVAVSQWSKVLFFWVRVNFAFHHQGLRVCGKSGDVQIPSFLMSSVSTVTDDLGCHVSCCSWSTVFHSQCNRLPEDFSDVHPSVCAQALWRCWFPYPADLTPAHRPTDCFTDHGVTSSVVLFRRVTFLYY